MFGAFFSQETVWKVKEFSRTYQDLWVKVILIRVLTNSLGKIGHHLFPLISLPWVELRLYLQERVVQTHNIPKTFEAIHMQSLKDFHAILNQTFIFLCQIQITSLGLLDQPTSNIVCYLIIDQR